MRYRYTYMWYRYICGINIYLQASSDIDTACGVDIYMWCGFIYVVWMYMWCR